MRATTLSFKSLPFTKENIAVAGLLFNTLSWHYLCRLIISRLGQNLIDSFFEQLCLSIVYVVTIVISAILGATFLKENKKLRILKAWVIFGVLTSLSTAFSAFSYSLLETIIIASSLGLSLGIAAPLCLDLFSKVTAVRNRGKIGGIILFITFSSVFILYESISSMDLMFSGFLLALWRFWSLPLLFLVPERAKTKGAVEEPHGFTLVLGNKVFLLYFIAWLMFTFIDSFQTIVINIGASEFSLFTKIIEPCIAGFSAIIIGAISDIIGRRRVLIFGFVFLGVAYAVLGLFPYHLISWLFYSIISGIAIGSASVLFIIVIWSEISIGNSVKFYAIGEIPLFIAETLSLLLTPFLTSVSQGSSFSLASFFLFIAVIPLAFAPETLPEKVIRERELKSYIEKAKRVREKFTKG